MNLTQVPISMIDTVAGDAGKVLTSNGSTLSWTASASIAPSSATTAKAWVNFNGTTSPGTIRSSYNVSSVTKNGTGDYTVNFTNAMADANYAVTQGYTASSSTHAYVAGVYTMTTGSVRMYPYLNYSNGLSLDMSMVSVIIFGN